MANTHETPTYKVTYQVVVLMAFRDGEMQCDRRTARVGHKVDTWEEACIEQRNETKLAHHTEQVVIRENHEMIW